MDNYSFNVYMHLHTTCTYLISFGFLVFFTLGETLQEYWSVGSLVS